MAMNSIKRLILFKTVYCTKYYTSNLLSDSLFYSREGKLLEKEATEIRAALLKSRTVTVIPAGKN